MEVYIEYVIIDNMVFDCLLLFAVAKTLKLPKNYWRIFAGGAVGTLLAAVSVLVDGIFAILLKAVCLFLMCLVCCGFGKKLFWHILLTVAYTFVMGGAIVGLFFLLQIDFSLGAEIAYDSPVPLGIYLLGAALAVFLIACLVQLFKQKGKMSPYLTKVTLSLETKHNVWGFFDSGNTLEVDGIPVCFAVGAFKKQISNQIAQAILNGSTVQVNYLTMAGQAQTLALPCELSTASQTRKVLLAVSKLKHNVPYDILLHQSFATEVCDINSTKIPNPQEAQK